MPGAGCAEGSEGQGGIVGHKIADAFPMLACTSQAESVVGSTNDHDATVQTAASLGCETRRESSAVAAGQCPIDTPAAVPSTACTACSTHRCMFTACPPPVRSPGCAATARRAARVLWKTRRHGAPRADGLADSLPPRDERLHLTELRRAPPTPTRAAAWLVVRCGQASACRDARARQRLADGGDHSSV